MRHNLMRPVQSLCRDLSSELAGEDGVFDIIWETYWKTIGASDLSDHPLGRVWHRGESGIDSLGALGDSHGQQLGTLYLVSAICDASAALVQDGVPEAVTAQKVGQALTAAMDRHNTPEHVRTIVGRHTPELLVALLNLERSQDFVRSEPSPFDIKVIVQRLHRGKWSSPAERSKAYAARIPKQANYDIVVDELALTVQVGDGDPVGLMEIPRMQRGMLGMALLNVGKRISHVDIQNFFGADDLEPESVYRYRNALKQLLGEDLRDRVIEQGVSKKYLIPSTGWSYLWLRRCEDPHQSELLSDVYKPKEA